jgi:hypothetical protein
LTTRRRRDTPPPDSTALPADNVLDDFRLEDLLDSRLRPAAADPEVQQRWMRARHRVLRIADERFDPRQILGLSTGEAEEWKLRRLQWLRARLTKEN